MLELVGDMCHVLDVGVGAWSFLQALCWGRSSLELEKAPYFLPFSREVENSMLQGPMKGFPSCTSRLPSRKKELSTKNSPSLSMTSTRDPRI